MVESLSVDGALTLQRTRAPQHVLRRESFAPVRARAGALTVWPERPRRQRSPDDYRRTGATTNTRLPRARRPDVLECRIASTIQDRMAAFGLVYDKYLAKGMLHANPYCMRVLERHLLPSTSVFVAFRNNEIIATVSLIGDGELGLPMDGIHPDVTQTARDEGLYVGEVSCLAFRQQELKDVLPIFLELTRLMSQSARANGMQRLLIGCIPQHARFYSRFLGFEQVGELRPYPTVRNTMGVACCLDFARIAVERPDCYDKYFSDQLPAAALTTVPMSQFEREAFSWVIHHSPQQLLQVV